MARPLADARRRPRAALAIVGTLLVSPLVLGRVARAAPPAIAVRSVAELHEGCPLEPSMADRLTARLPRIHEAALEEPAVQVEVHVERRGNLSHGRLTLASGSEHAEREASSPSCEEVLAALAVMAAIGLDQGELPLPSPAPLPPPVAPSPSESRVSVVRRRSPVPTPKRVGQGLRLSLGSGIDLSNNGSAIVTPTLFGELGLPGIFTPTLRLGIGRSFSESFATARGTVRVQWSELVFSACGNAFQAGAIGVGPCADGEIGRLDAHTVAPLPLRSHSRGWATAGASARLSWQLNPVLSVDMRAGVRVPLTRHELVFDPGTRIYEPPSVIPFVGASFTARLR